MKEFTIKGYEIEELSDYAKAYALDRLLEVISVEDDMQLVARDLADDIKEIYGFNNLCIRFDLNRSQGSGASFTFDKTDMMDILNGMLSREVEEMNPPKVFEYMKSKYFHVWLECKVIDYHYSHPNTVRIYHEIEHIHRISTEEYLRLYSKEDCNFYDDALEKHMEDFINKVKENIKKLMDTVYSDLLETYEHLTSEKNLIELAEVYDYYFDEQGDILKYCYTHGQNKL